jgi:hypothetical protein
LVHTDSIIIIIIIIRADHAARMSEMRNAYRILVGKPEGNIQVRRRRQRHRWEDNTNMYFKETGWDGVDWVGFAQDRDRWRLL